VAKSPAQSSLFFFGLGSTFPLRSGPHIAENESLGFCENWTQN
jgi:hypothetical protein